MNESCHIWMIHVTYEWVMSRMNQSCHVWMSHVTYEWATHFTIRPSDETYSSKKKSLVKYEAVAESFHMWMSHVTNERVMSRINKSLTQPLRAEDQRTNESCEEGNGSCLVWMSHFTYEWVMGRESWVMSHLCGQKLKGQMSHFTRKKKSKSHVTHMNEWCHGLNESRDVWISHVMYAWDMSHLSRQHIQWQMSHFTYEEVKEWCHTYEWFVTYEWVMAHLSRLPVLAPLIKKWVMSHTNES